MDPMNWVTQYHHTKTVDLKAAATPWYSTQERRSQCHNTVVIEVMYHFFSFALLRPKEGIQQFRMDTDKYINGVSNLMWGHVRGDILTEATKRTKALGLFLDNNPSFLS